MVLYPTVYVRISNNRIHLKHLKSGKTFDALPSAPFTTTRLLVGELRVAATTLKHGLRNLMSGRWFVASPRVLMHPLEKVEGGLAEIEERIFREMALGVGAARAVVWVGRDLSDIEVKEKLDGK